MATRKIAPGGAGPSAAKNAAKSTLAQRQTANGAQRKEARETKREQSRK